MKSTSLQESVSHIMYRPCYIYTHISQSETINVYLFFSDSLGFCQVYLHCDLDLCVSRNERRSEPVLTKVIQEMEMRLEPPNPEKNLWEKNSISLSSTDVFSKCDM